jgi:hypothetical protein
MIKNENMGETYSMHGLYTKSVWNIFSEGTISDLEDNGKMILIIIIIIVPVGKTSLLEP